MTSKHPSDFKVLQVLRQRHRQWPHHEELYHLLKSARTVVEVKSSLRLKFLCSKLQALEVSRKSAEHRMKSDAVYNKAQIIQQQLQPAKEVKNATKKKPKEMIKDAPKVNNMSVDEDSRRNSLEIYTATFHDRPRIDLSSSRYCRRSKISENDRKILDRLVLNDKKGTRRSDESTQQTSHTENISGEDISAGYIQKVDAAVKKAIQELKVKPPCYKCAAVDRKKAGVKQFPYYTVKLLWRNCCSLDPITKADLYSALSPYGEIEELLMLSDHQAIVTFQGLCTTLMLSTLDIKGHKVKPVFYYQLYTDNIELKKSGEWRLVNKRVRSKSAARKTAL
ncbi:uncharacterized protein [Watersipora subatra]|uniref:uncharacterized protein n=1 Tax=Watersipora subatra TaxID=2589382 RepID=UPI00355C2D7E